MKNRGTYHIAFMKIAASVFIPSAPLAVMLAIFRILGMGHYSEHLVMIICSVWVLLIAYTLHVAVKTPYPSRAVVDEESQQ